MITAPGAASVRRWLREAGYWTLVLSGLPLLFWWLNREKVAVLGYHGVAPAPARGVANWDAVHVHPDRFRRQMRFLKRWYRVVSLAAACEPAGACHRAAVTFDDGYRSVVRWAYPVLREERLAATLFVCSGVAASGSVLWWDRLRTALDGTARQHVEVDTVEEGTVTLSLDTPAARARAAEALEQLAKRVAPERQDAVLKEILSALGTDGGPGPLGETLSLEELRSLALAGVGIGSHARDHVGLPRLPVEAIRFQVAGSRAALEAATGAEVRWFAYPHGERSPRVAAELVAAGYRGALSTDEGLNDPRRMDRYAIRRLGVDDRLSFAHFIVVVSGLRDFLKGVWR